MSVAQRTYYESSVRRFTSIGLAIAVIATAVAGCSANISRLDAPPSFAIGEGASGTSARRSASGSSADIPAANPASGPPAAAYSPPPAIRPRGGVEVAGLPALEEPQAARTSQQPRALAVNRGSETPAAPSQSAERGRQIEVQAGDTLYGLSRRHNVMISDIMAVNNLQNPNLKPGQKLFLPATAGVRATPQVRPERPLAGQTKVPAQAPAQAPATAQVEASGDTYTVKPGDSLYAIAARHKLKVADLQRVNSIANARAVKPGTVLKLPVGHAGVAQAEPQVDTQVEPRAKAGPAPPRGAQPQAASPVGAVPGAPNLKVLNGDAGRQAAVADAKTMSDAAPATPPRTQPAPQAAPAATAPAGKLRWPVKGRIVQGFGARADGTHNDGVDIAVPAGADVLAAEGGVVAYAGNEVKTYGNLVLVRHDNGLVTAYAYNDKLLVQRGDRVKRGQAIAKAGKTGLADQPQLHFEVRVGSKPVDPVGYLEKM